MRTTMNLPDDLYRSARVRAAEEGRTVTSVMEEALRSFLKINEPEAQPFVLKTLPSRANAVTPADVGDNAAIRELLDAEDPQGFHANA
ncbi:MAG: DUF2191 domain-containing protein [Kineosporiaceae bacterium]|nr:DUF2191 domain-containing protein [Aeromicrobium sp.]